MISLCLYNTKSIHSSSYASTHPSNFNLFLLRSASQGCWSLSNLSWHSGGIFCYLIPGQVTRQPGVRDSWRRSEYQERHMENKQTPRTQKAEYQGLKPATLSLHHRVAWISNQIIFTNVAGASRIMNSGKLHVIWSWSTAICTHWEGPIMRAKQF